MNVELPSVDLPSVDPPKKTKPMPKPKSKSTPATAPTPATAVGPKVSMLLRAEGLCTALASGRDLTADDCLLFEELSWDRNKIDRETRRAGSIKELQRAAGTKAELTLKKTELIELTESTAGQVERLDIEIQAKMDQRDGLAFGVREMENDVQQRSRAMKELREKVPPHIQRMHDQLRGQLKNSTMNKSRLGVESKIRRLKNLPETFTAETAESIKLAANNISAAERPQGLVNSKGDVHRAGWATWVASQKVDLAAMVVELESLEAEFESRMALIDQTLDFYLT